MSSGHDKTAVPVNSHSCGHLHKTKLADIPAQNGRGQEPPPPTEELRRVDVFRGERELVLRVSEVPEC